MPFFMRRTDILSQARELVIQIGRQLGQRAMYFEVRYFDGVEIIDISDAS